jgi:hypothetical protein
MENTTPQSHSPYAFIMWLVVLVFHSTAKLLGILRPIPTELLSWSEEVSFILAIVVSLITIYQFIEKRVKKKNKTK